MSSAAIDDRESALSDDGGLAIEKLASGHEQPDHAISHAVRPSF